MSFLTPEIMTGVNWRALERAVARLISHCGWEDVVVVGETNDKGADVMGNRLGKTGELETYVFQVKAVSGDNYVGIAAVDEALAAMHTYGARHAIVATNGDFTRSASDRVDTLKGLGYSVRLWNGVFLQELLSKWPLEHHKCKSPRDYQGETINAVIDAYDQGLNQAYFVLATGLGKSIVAANIVNILAERGLKRSLVLCHMKDLALQLERSFWSQLTKDLPTRVFFEGVPPVPCDGVNFGLYQTLSNTINAIDPEAFDVVIVDEAHHAPARGFRNVLSELSPKMLVGMTATPFRDDGLNLEDVFGSKVAQVSLIEGMSRGYLAQVDYNVYCDNIDWKEVGRATKGKMSIRDLNKRLFLPQRDEAIVSEIIKMMDRVADPRVIIFSSSIEHGERFARLLEVNGLPCQPLSGKPRAERYDGLMKFSRGSLRAITAVDVLNEGIDVPEVNVVVFLRCTHSRRIFLQQLGRGLRISENKDRVMVMDFVADIRRLADMAELEREVRNAPRERKDVIINSADIRFSNDHALPFMEAWMREAGDIGGMDENVKLNFPAFET